MERESSAPMAPGQNTDGKNTDGQNTDGKNALEHELGKNGKIQIFGPACNFSVGILSIYVLSWSLGCKLCVSHFVCHNFCGTFCVSQLLSS